LALFIRALSKTVLEDSGVLGDDITWLSRLFLIFWMNVFPQSSSMQSSEKTGILGYTLLWKRQNLKNVLIAFSVHSSRKQLSYK
jgi:hypothetical protein